MSQGKEEAEGKSGHQAIIDDDWLRAREYIRRAEAADIDPGRVLWPVGSRHPNYQKALAAHAAIIQFRDDIFPFRAERSRERDIEEMWQQKVCTVSIDGSAVSISLENLGNWAHKHHNKQFEKISVVDGKITDTEKYRVLLPVSACRELYRHMEDILKQLGLTAATKDWTKEETANPEHLAGLLKNRGQEQAIKRLPNGFQEGDS